MGLYLLDTDICSYVIRNRPETVRKRMNGSSNAKVNRTVVGAFLRHVSVLDWDRDAADAYAEMRVELEAKGQPIVNMDLLIAAHARSLRAVLVTNNERHHGRISGLKQA
ncbi:MAG: type II toxin-antitoxin system VapC family toxin [Gammaproteobacteria bacterium]